MRNHRANRWTVMIINLLAITLVLQSCVNKEGVPMSSASTDNIAKKLTDAGYGGLFLAGDRSQADPIWSKGENRTFLEQIVLSSRYSDLTRLLASEMLYAKVLEYPPKEWGDTLAYLYSQALVITGDQTGTFQLSGNLWGFMYHTDELGIKDYGSLGTHLVETGSKMIPYLTKLLDNPNQFFYEGSQEATLGNSLAYRVKDAAAYYIGKITGIPVKFYQKTADRDAEIAKLVESLKNHE